MNKENGRKIFTSPGYCTHAMLAKAKIQRERVERSINKHELEADLMNAAQLRALGELK